MTPKARHIKITNVPASSYLKNEVDRRSFMNMFYQSRVLYFAFFWDVLSHCLAPTFRPLSDCLLVFMLTDPWEKKLVLRCSGLCVLESSGRLLPCCRLVLRPVAGPHRDRIPRPGGAGNSWAPAHDGSAAPVRSALRPLRRTPAEIIW